VLGLKLLFRVRVRVMDRVRFIASVSVRVRVKASVRLTFGFRVNFSFRLRVRLGLGLGYRSFFVSVMPRSNVMGGFRVRVSVVLLLWFLVRANVIIRVIVS
jgi:hypothetical protein